LIKVRELITALEKRGWHLVAIKGSHRQFKHTFLPGRVTIAGHLNDQLPPGALRNGLKQARMTKEDL